MSKSYYYFFIFLFSLASLFILTLKGYFNIRSFKVEKRPDIERYANSKLTNNSFFVVQNKRIESEILSKFNDVDTVIVKKNLNMTVNLTVTNKKAFGKVNEETFLSENGRIFYSKLLYSKDLPSIIVKDFSLNTKYLSEDQMKFIKRLKGFPKVTVYLLSPFGFTITSDSYNIEVPYNFDNTENMVQVVNSEIAKRSEPLSKLVVLKDKIVFKK